MSEDGDEDAPGDDAGGSGDGGPTPPAGTGGTDDPGDGAGPDGRDGEKSRANVPDAGDRAGSADGPGDDTDADAGDGTPSHAVDDAPATGSGESSLARLRAVTDSRVGLAVVGITVLALAGRLLLLGDRVAHWDEGRVAYWTLQYAQTGYFEYRPVVHGPFLFQVNEFLFSFVGSNDFVSRLPVAVVGGLLPASAWLFRERLKGAETVALAGLLALNPLLVYYSRFMRNDVLVAAFMFFALGFVVRAYDSGNGWYAVPAGLTMALGFTAKENAIVYLVCWFGAAALLLDHRLLDSVRGARARLTGSAARDGLREGVRSDALRLVGVAGILALNPYVAFRTLEGSSVLPYAFAGAVLAGYLVAIRDAEIPEHLAVVGASLALVVGVGTAGPAVLSPVTWLLAIGLFGVGAYRALDRGANPWHYVTAFAFVFFAFDVASGLSHLETMLGYTLFWLLAGAMLVDETLFADDTRSTRSPLGRLTGTFPPTLAAYAVTIGTLVFFYAPRHPDPNELGLWNAVGRTLRLQPGMLVDVFEDALLGGATDMWYHWVEGADVSFEVYRERLDTMIATMIHSAGLLFAFSAIGFVYDRWSGGGPRDVVAMGGYWGFVSVLGYPYATDIWAPWIAVHAIVPLAIPAAVGLAGVYALGRDSFDRGDVLTGTLVGVLLIALVAPAAVTAVDVSYVNSSGEERMIADLTGDEQRQRQYVLQWAQPDNGLKDTLGTVRKVAESNDGTDVLFVGTTPPGDEDNEHWYVPDEQVCLERPPVHLPEDTCEVAGLSWHSRLPLPWYLESYGASVESTHPDTDLGNVSEFPPVVFAYDWDQNEVGPALPDRYEAHEHPFKLWYEGIVVYVDTEAVP
jgi:uncharacterized protein (TIGR03663 family)